MKIQIQQGPQYRDGQNPNFMYKPFGEHTHLTFGVHFDHVSMGSAYHAYHMTLLWSEFVAEWIAGLNFCACCAF